MIAEQVDRRHQRLGLQGQEPGRAREVVAVGIGIDQDLVAVDLRIEDVGSAAEVHQVEHLQVLAQLLARHLELLEDRIDL